ncbi:MAG TPA: carboxypeptidase-like regulatory domain-containing protein, partial [Pyrinomonadaceae bacterium]|nr:carboxypeptidase-like regulatory domain-containing protein [Pyrinomonadaceae bacterium]
MRYSHTPPGRAAAWLLLLLTFTFPAALFAQANNARFGGTVLDPSGAVLPGAAITIRSLRTNFSNEAVTNAEGRFSFSELPIGEYELTITLAGFQKFLRTDLTLLTGQVIDLPITLQVGSVESVVEVTGEVPLVQT